MTQFNKTQKKYRWPDIEALMKERIGIEKTAELFGEAMELSEQYAARHENLKGFEKTHAEAAHNIAAIYIPMRKVVGSRARCRKMRSSTRSRQGCSFRSAGSLRERPLEIRRALRGKIFRGIRQKCVLMSIHVLM